MMAKEIRLVKAAPICLAVTPITIQTVKKTGHSDPGFFGGHNHYDNKGRKVGYSEPSLFGGFNHYDSNGAKVGHSDPNLFGDFNHYDD